MVDWKHKLSSRKFWVTIVGFLTAILYAFNVAEADVEKVVSVVMAMSTLITYILAEAHVDGSRNSVE